MSEHPGTDDDRPEEPPPPAGETPTVPGVQLNPQTGGPTPDAEPAQQEGQQPGQPPGQQPGQPGAPYYPPYGHPQYPQPGQQPYGQPQYGQPYGQQYGQPQYPQYPQPGQPPQPVYGQQYGQPYAQYPYQQTKPNHPQAGLALGLGLGGVVGTFVCLLPILVSPFAWAIGHRVRREIRESNGQYDGDGMAQAGMILGIVGTVLLALVIVALVVFGIALAADSSGTSNL